MALCCSFTGRDRSVSAWCGLVCLCLQVDLGRINSLIAQNAGLKAMLEEEHLQLEVSGRLQTVHASKASNLQSPSTKHQSGEQLAPLSTAATLAQHSDNQLNLERGCVHAKLAF